MQREPTAGRAVQTTVLALHSSPTNLRPEPRRTSVQLLEGTGTGDGDALSGFPSFNLRRRPEHSTG
jgi:hypothetical protein